MSEVKFTKGEWIFCDGDSHSKEVCITTEEREESLTVPICEMDIRFSGDIGLEQVANMHLIAAAPAMYEMLARCARELAKNGYETETVHELLAKARGE